jgi:hypothetical protein
VAGSTAVLAVSFAMGYVAMVLIGLGGMAYGLRQLRPQIQGIRDMGGEPTRWSNFLISSSVLFAIVALLIGMMLFVFGVALVALG